MKYFTAATSAAVLALLGGEVQAGEKCYALSLSGGGAFGAYEAGVLYGMWYAIPDKSEMEYSVVTGVSAGSINSMAVSMFEEGDEKLMVDTLTDLWANLHDKDVYKNWPIPIVEGITKKSGVYNDAPLLKFLREIKDKYKTLKRKTVVSAVDVNTGTYHLFNETEIDPAKAAVSSSSIPFVFPNQ